MQVRLCVLLMKVMLVSTFSDSGFLVIKFCLLHGFLCSIGSRNNSCRTDIPGLGHQANGQIAGKAGR